MADGASSSGSVLRLAVVVGALGVVFGDIGTSPIYTLQTVFAPTDPHPVASETENIHGVVSLVFWSVTLLVTVTYVLLAMRVDSDGEGGIMALITPGRLVTDRATWVDRQGSTGIPSARVDGGLGCGGTGSAPAGGREPGPTTAQLH